MELKILNDDVATMASSTAGSVYFQFFFTFALLVGLVFVAQDRFDLSMGPLDLVVQPVLPVAVLFVMASVWPALIRLQKVYVDRSKGLVIRTSLTLAGLEETTVRLSDVEAVVIRRWPAMFSSRIVLRTSQGTLDLVRQGHLLLRRRHMRELRALAEFLGVPLVDPRASRPDRA